MTKIIFLSLLITLNLSIPHQLNAQPPKWKHFNGIERITDIVPHGNSLWLATSTCILEVNLITNSIQKYTGADGIGYNILNTNLALGSDGTLYAGGWMNGIDYLPSGANRWINKLNPYKAQKDTFLALEGFAVDSKGNFWIASGYGYIYKMTPSGSLTTLFNQGGEKVIVDKNDNVWFGIAPSNFSGYLLKFDNQGKSTKYDNSNSAIPNDRITDIMVDPDSDIWIATQDSEYVRFDGINWTRYNVGHTSSDAGIKKHIGLLQNKYVVVSSGTNEGCSHPLLFKFDGSQFTPISNTPYLPGTNEYITSMASDLNGILYIASKRDSLTKLFLPPRLLSYDGENFKEISLAKRMDIPFGAQDRIALDSSGNLWVASYLGGISKYNGAVWTHWDFTTDDLPTANSSLSIAVDRQGVVWASNGDIAVSGHCGGGSFAGGMSFYDGTKWTTLSSESKYRIQYYNILVGPDNKKYFLSYDGKNNYSFEGNTWSIFENVPSNAAMDHNGALWFTRNDTLFKYQNGGYSSYAIPSSNGVSSYLAIGKDNAIWFTTDLNLAGAYSDSVIVTKFKEGVWQFFSYSIRNLEITYSIQRNRNPDQRIAVESSEKVWIGTSGTGLFSCDTKGGGIWQNYNPVNSDIGIVFIGDILVDKVGNKWITSANGEGTIVEFNENGIITAVRDNDPQVIERPNDFLVLQNFPNPFNPSTKISFALPQRSHVKIQIFNMLGQLVNTLLSDEEDAGYHELTWNAVGLSSGIYIYRIEAVSKENAAKVFTEVKKMQLIK